MPLDLVIICDQLGSVGNIGATGHRLAMIPLSTNSPTSPHVQAADPRRQAVIPPSIGIVAPVMKLEAREPSSSASPFSSSGSPKPSPEEHSRYRAWQSPDPLSFPPAMFVRIGPGAIPFTHTPNSASSMAACRTRLTTARLGRDIGIADMALGPQTPQPTP